MKCKDTWRVDAQSVGVVELAAGAKLAFPGALIKAAAGLARAQGQAAGGQLHGVLRRVVKLAALPETAVPRLLEKVADGLAWALGEQRRQAAALVAHNAHCKSTSNGHWVSAGRGATITGQATFAVKCTASQAGLNHHKLLTTHLVQCLALARRALLGSQEAGGDPWRQAAPRCPGSTPPAAVLTCAHRAYRCQGRQLGQGCRR